MRGVRVGLTIICLLSVVPAVQAEISPGIVVPNPYRDTIFQASRLARSDGARGIHIAMKNLFGYLTTIDVLHGPRRDENGSDLIILFNGKPTSSAGAREYASDIWHTDRAPRVDNRLVEEVVSWLMGGPNKPGVRAVYVPWTVQAASKASRRDGSSSIDITLASVPGGDLSQVTVVQSRTGVILLENGRRVPDKASQLATAQWLAMAPNEPAVDIQLLDEAVRRILSVPFDN